MKIKFNLIKKRVLWSLDTSPVKPVLLVYVEWTKQILIGLSGEISLNWISHDVSILSLMKSQGFLLFIYFWPFFFPFPFCCRVIIGRRHHTNPKHSTTPSTHRWRANSRRRTIQTRFHRCWIIKHDGRTSWRWHRDGPISMNWRLLTDSCQGGLFYLDSIRVHFDVS